MTLSMPCEDYYPLLSVRYPIDFIHNEPLLVCSGF